jgi:hypothetical protein
MSKPKGFAKATARSGKQTKESPEQLRQRLMMEHSDTFALAQASGIRRVMVMDDDGKTYVFAAG